MPLSDEQKAKLTYLEELRLLDVHRKKILLSNAVLVCNGNKVNEGYYGESVKAEIAWAELNNIPVLYTSTNDAIFKLNEQKNL